MRRGEGRKEGEEIDQRGKRGKGGQREGAGEEQGWRVDGWSGGFKRRGGW